VGEDAARARGQGRAAAAERAETLWLAGHGWEVTAVDFSPSALAHARATAATMGLAARIEWVEGDLASWTPPRERFDLVVCLYDLGEWTVAAEERPRAVAGTGVDAVIVARRGT
jgi:SAM-dependent methyltransferase